MTDQTPPPRLSADELGRLGEMRFGPEWVTPLAHALDVNLRNLQRWKAGQLPVPPWVGPAIRRMLERDAVAMLQAAAALPAETVKPRRGPDAAAAHAEEAPAGAP